MGESKATTYREAAKPPCWACTRPNVIPVAAAWGRGWKGLYMYPCVVCRKEHSIGYWMFSRLHDDLLWGWDHLIRPLLKRV